MLIEMLFSMVFFLLPIIGMFGAVIARGLQQEQKVEGVEKKTIPHIGRRQKPTEAPVFVDSPVIRYQLIESKRHEPLKIGHQKYLFYQRAGP